MCTPTILEHLNVIDNLETYAIICFRLQLSLKKRECECADMETGYREQVGQLKVIIELLHWPIRYF